MSCKISVPPSAMAPGQLCQLWLFDSGLSATVRGKRPEPSRGEGNRQLPQVTSSLPGALGKGCSKPVLSATTATTSHGSAFKLRTQSLRHIQELRSHRKLVVTALDVADTEHSVKAEKSFWPARPQGRRPGCQSCLPGRQQPAFPRCLTGSRLFSEG